MRTNANTHKLPEEILEQIIGYLEKTDLARVAAVSRTFWRLAVAKLYHEIRFDPYAYRESQLRVLKSSPHLTTLVRRLTIDIAPLPQFQDENEIQEFNWGHPLLKDEPPVHTARSALLSLIPHLPSLESLECHDLSGEPHSTSATPARSLMRTLFSHCRHLRKLTRTDWWRDLGCSYGAVGPTALTHLTISVPESYFAVDEDGLVGVDEGACEELRALLRASPALTYLDFYRGRVSMGLIFRGRRGGRDSDGDMMLGRSRRRRSSAWSRASVESGSGSGSSSGSGTPPLLDKDDERPVVLPNLKTLVLWATFVEEKAEVLVGEYLATRAGIFPALTGLELVSVRCEKEGLYVADQVSAQMLMDAVVTLRDCEVKTITERQIYDFSGAAAGTEDLHHAMSMVNEKHGRQPDRRSRFRQW
ncbi:uncharacterized protein H6S33_006470 [Morchella sextelata]|uniref:uncharacterized protein n=1 Tax=Morchella sextelata TaxID=1174677 RepID=UPI001D04E94E|nr:uncharacterized protein H6S33_006470 [Morchella sextelata]KAH0604802.1 hypothetical protein H6S33_006470 [Morchella sextelata]